MAVETNKKLVTVADLANMATKNDTLYPRKAAVTAEIDEKVSAQVSSTYKAAGSVASVDDLPELKKANLGKVVNMTEDFTTTADFAEGEGDDLPAGTNVAVVEIDGAYKYDALAGLVDLTAYETTANVTTKLDTKVDKLAGAGLYPDTDKDKLAALEVAETTEVEAALNAALGITVTPDPEEEEGA